MIEIEKVDHLGIRVMDVDRAFAFYALLGFGGPYKISELKSTRELACIVKESGAKDYRVVILRAESFPFYMSDHVRLVPYPALIESMLEESAPMVAVVKEKHLREMDRIPRSRFFVWKVIPSGRALAANFPNPTGP